jgi:hypothetical protein
MNSHRKIGITLLLAYTLILTALRSIRFPNDFAEAQWLLDYRFGLVKRGLVGEIVSRMASIGGGPVTENLILVLSGLFFVLFCIVILIIAVRINRHAGWTSGGVLVTLVFLSSPFIVMSAHLIGYYDNIIILAGILSVYLILIRRTWLSAIVLGLALFIHENSLLLLFPIFCLTWLLVNVKSQKEGLPRLPFLPLFLPVAAFILLAAAQELFVQDSVQATFSSYLSGFSFIENGRNIAVPAWIFTPIGDYLAEQSGAFPERISAIAMHGLAFPSALAILLFTISVYKILDISIESILLLVVCLSPLLMHIVAWDTPRIWTFIILEAFLCLWIYSEIYPSKTESPAIRLFSLLVLALNILIRTPLMDNEVDRFTMIQRLALYAPVMIGSLSLLLSSKEVRLYDRLSIQGLHVSRLIKRPGNHPAGKEEGNREP